MKNMESGDSPLPIEERIRGLSRDELLMALRMRKHYQPEAAAAAVKEAIRRGLIRTEEELSLPEFDEPDQKFTLFPCPESKNARINLFRSLLRGVMIAGIIPVVYGIMKFPLMEVVEGVALISLGVVWIAMAWFIMERHEKRLILPMGILALLSMVYAIRILMLFKYPEWSDFIIPGVLYVVIFYFLLYARSLLRKFTPSGQE